jgi:hypothetical protein
MTDKLSLAIFAPHVNSTFHVAMDGRPVTLTLVLAQALTPVPVPAGVQVRPDPFELQFEEPHWSLPQQVHDLVHPLLGTLSIVLAPIGPTADKSKFRYQAIFN